MTGDEVGRSGPPDDGVPHIDDWNRLLEGRVAVVTGGGDGIGAGIARLFAQHGALVEVAEADRERADRIHDEVSSAGGSIRCHVVDVTADDDVARLAEAVLAEHGRADVLVNNVGDYRPLVPFRIRRQSRGSSSTTSTCATSSPSHGLSSLR